MHICVADPTWGLQIVGTGISLQFHSNQPLRLDIEQHLLGEGVTFTNLHQSTLRPEEPEAMIHRDYLKSWTQLNVCSCPSGSLLLSASVLILCHLELGYSSLPLLRLKPEPWAWIGLSLFSGKLAVLSHVPTLQPMKCGLHLSWFSRQEYGWFISYLKEIFPTWGSEHINIFISH